jgi:hypothetical protein
MQCCSRKSRFQLTMCLMQRLEVGTSLPLAQWLAERDNPFQFQTSDATVIDATHSAAPVLRKPFRPEQLIAAFAALLAKER